VRRFLSTLVATGALLLVAGVPGAASASTASASTASHGFVFPKVSGAYGQTPKITFTKGAKAPTSLESKILHRGTGPVTKKADLIAVNYVGQIWDGKVFDSSFSRKQMLGTGIGVHAVIEGWDKTLVGIPTGSRVLIVIPPADGYGKSGQPSAGITGKDDLVFVVDVVAAYNHTIEAQSNAKLLKRTVGGVTVSGALGHPASIKVAAGAAKPTAVKTIVLARGSGKAITPGLVVCQLLVSSWTNVVEESTWKLGTPYGANVPSTASSSPFGALKGIPLGSRVLIELPASSTSGGPYALVVDLVSEPHDPQS
jgi:peptidylprolyl isomerase